MPNQNKNKMAAAKLSDGYIRWVSFLPGEPAAAEVAKHSALHWSHVGPQSVHET